MAGLSITGQMKISTLQEGFLGELGLTLRVYDGRSFADPTQTLGQVRKKKGSGLETILSPCRVHRAPPEPSPQDFAAEGCDLCAQKPCVREARKTSSREEPFHYPHHSGPLISPI